MFLTVCNEAFGYTHEQTLNSSFVLMMAMLREHGYLVNERNKSVFVGDEETKEDEGEWTELIDFETGQKKQIRKMIRK